tara:strand:+ start:13090 stop:14745 length:1656 start_codon:yes stop_codon:yes gene_type:complete
MNFINSWRALVTACVTSTLFFCLAYRHSSAVILQDPLENAFQNFWNAQSTQDIFSATKSILAESPQVERVRERLRVGRSYVSDVPTGRQVLSRQNQDGTEHFYVLNVPVDYDPALSYPVRFYLHGGVMRAKQVAGEWWRSEDRWVKKDSIVVSPASWNGSVWWQRSQIENLSGLLTDLKRIYNVDENRVYLLGVSDGATGAYYHAFKANTAWAGYLLFIGHPAVLGNPRSAVDGEMHVVNLRGKPFFVVNGARDRLYPASIVEPYMQLFKEAGINVDFIPKPDAGHDLSWLDEEDRNIETFISSVRRTPFPDRLSLETESAREFNRTHWLIINELGAVTGESAFDEYDQVTVPGPRTPLGINTVGEVENGLGLKVLEVGRPSLAAEAGLDVNDIIVDIGGIPTPTADAAREAILGASPGDSLPVTVDRRGVTKILTLKFPSQQRGFSRPAFARNQVSGRVDLEREGNSVTLLTRGVRRLSLLLSREQFDFSKPVTVTVNNQVAFDEFVTPSVTTLLRWATVDWDRSMLVDVELEIDVAAVSGVESEVRDQR